jgi:asparagine synthase (glutamine-hydrolysing)
MCGIAGFVDASTPAEKREQAVQRMCASMIHRGPDDSGMASRGPATIGMRRLSIFDPVNGQQPMVTPDGRFTIVFNGAIYNFRELQAELEASGWGFRTHCDTEVLLAALAQWGREALKRLRGMFAFALWDSADESLLLARDPFGIKPLYFAHDGDRLPSPPRWPRCSRPARSAARSTRPRSRTTWPGSPCRRPGRSTAGCSASSPASACCSRAASGRSHRVGRSVHPRGPRPCATRAEFIKRLRERLDDTIREHVLADVPVGHFLSGGLDSAVVAGLMSRRAATPLKTFSIGFEEDGFSEADDAEASARHFGAIHHTRILTGDEVARDLDKFLAACDQPTGDGVNTYYASQTAQQGGVKVALSGLGGDELFGGYPSFRAIPALAGRLPLWGRVPRPLRAVAGLLNRGGTRARSSRTSCATPATPTSWGRSAPGLLGVQAPVKCWPRTRSTMEGSAPFHPQLRSLRAAVGPDDLFSLVSAWELRTYMADVLLRDSDVMSMRHSLELRVPFIDRP